MSLNRSEGGSLPRWSSRTFSTICRQIFALDVATSLAFLAAFFLSFSVMGFSSCLGFFLAWSAARSVARLRFFVLVLVLGLVFVVVLVLVFVLGVVLLLGFGARRPL